MAAVEPDPWVRGWCAGKYRQPGPLPTGEDFADWLEGFRTGCAEVGDFEVWRLRLAEHLLRVFRGIYAQLADLLL